jgi:phenylacetate-CoA ligase
VSSLLLAAYHRLPPGARSAVASARGLYLQRWRYGPDTERLVAEALERDQWSGEQWRAWQDEQLGRLLDRAARQVPAYREQWAARRRAGDRASWEQLEHWPVLTKDVLRANPRAFLADDCDTRAMLHEHTSGTTGKPLDLWSGRAAVRAWYALFEARWRRWNGVTRHDRWALLGGQLVVPVRASRPPFWVWNAALRQLYMSSYHLAPPLLPHYVEALRRYRVRYLLGYSSSLEALARSMLATGAAPLGLEVVLTSAEPLLASQRATMEQAFGCPVRETYGMSEAVAAASECKGGALHLWPDAGHLDILADGRSAPAGAVGDMVCTGLLNWDMPLIRYAVGDRGAVAAPGHCACGRSLPRLAAVEGRSDDVLHTADGRMVGRLDPVFKARLQVREAQVVQETLDRVRVLVVPDAGYTEADAQAIASAVRERMGEITVVVDRVESIPRGSNGKFRAVVSQLDDAARARIGRA